MAPNGLVHKTWFCHDPATRPCRKNLRPGSIMTKGLITHRTHSAEQEMFENNNKQGSRIQAEPKLTLN